MVFPFWSRRDFGRARVVKERRGLHDLRYAVGDAMADIMSSCPINFLRVPETVCTDYASQLCKEQRITDLLFWP